MKNTDPFVPPRRGLSPRARAVLIEAACLAAAMLFVMSGLWLSILLNT